MPGLRDIRTDLVLTVYAIDDAESLELPLFESTVSAGFPSPAEDYEEVRLDLNQHLIQHPSATFYVRVRGHSMRDADINDGDLLVVDRALRPKDGDIAVCIVDNEFTVKQLATQNNRIYLRPANPAYQPLCITEQHDFRIWGVVTYVIHKV